MRNGIASIIIFSGISFAPASIIITFSFVDATVNFKSETAFSDPGGFNRREGKASENAILTSRVIDRPMRPLFPKDYRNDVTINNMVMSVDPECSPDL